MMSSKIHNMYACLHICIIELEAVMARLSVLEGQSRGDKKGDIDEIKQERLQRYAEKKAKSKFECILLLHSYACCLLL